MDERWHVKGNPALDRSALDVGECNYTFPPLDERVEANGIRSIMLADYEQKTLHAVLQFPVGRFDDPPGLEGISELMLGCMQKGSIDHPSEKLAWKMEQIGASFFADVGDEHMSLGVRTLEKYADTIIPLFWEVIRTPAFDSKEFKRLKREMLTAIQAEYSDPHALAGKHFQSELHGRHSRGGRAPTLRTLKRISLLDISRLYCKSIVPEGATLVIAGARSTEAMRKCWGGLFTSWPASGQPRRERKSESALVNDTPRVRIVKRPNSSQTSLIVGHSTIGEFHDDRNALALANYILGGGNFSSRLTEQIRSRTGKTYGISSQFVTNTSYGTWLTSTTTQSHQLKEVLETILDVCRDIAENGVTAEELEKAKRYAVGNMAFELEGVGNVTEKLLWLRFYGRQNEYVERFSESLRGISLDDVNRAARKWLKCDSMTIVAVGPTTEIGDQLKDYGHVTRYKVRADP